MNKYWLLILFALFSGNLLACKCEAIMIKRADKKAEYIFAAANNVFLAKITKSTLTGKMKGNITTEHNFDVIENFKGNPETLPHLKTGSANPTSCNDDGMTEGKYYLIFTDTTEIFDCSVMDVDLEHDYFKGLFTQLSKLRSNQQNQAQKKDADKNSAS